MRCTRRLLAVLFPMVWSLAQATAYAQAAGWEKDELVWRTEHSKELQKPDGWLSLVGLEWLALDDADASQHAAASPNEPVPRSRYR